MSRSLVDLLEDSVRRQPERSAVLIPGGDSLTYAALGALSDRVRNRLVALGVKPGDRVGMRLRKSVDGVAIIFGILKAGAAYVPVDAESPAARGAYIHNHCAVKAVFTEVGLRDDVTRELTAISADAGNLPPILALDVANTDALSRLLDEFDTKSSAPAESSARPAPDDLAYILYTSGSTGNPKGVVLTHRNALSFIDWCSDVFAPAPTDIFSSHAPFHFDLSILDIYVPLKHGAKLVLIGEALGKDPLKLAQVIAEERISHWYSTPSILSLLANYGKLPKYDYSALRMVFFAGEVFPIAQFRALRALWPGPRYFNLYGPTETNVCTWYEVESEERIAAMPTFPIGRICEPNLGKVVDENGEPVPFGKEGELVVHGPNVMVGYWNLPERNAAAFFTDVAGRKWYRTGDIVTEHEGLGYRYVSRRDRMVKRRGYRVELGEIEVGLLKHPDIREAAVVAVADAEAGVRVNAFVSCADGRTLNRIQLKSISAQNLPPYMIPDAFTVLPALPRTSTDKINYQALKASGGG
jgi:amino acid adenylation domain-containing protein